MFGFSHLPFSTSFTPLYNGEVEDITLFTDIGEDLELKIKQSDLLILDILQDSLLDLYIQEEESVTFTIEKFPQQTL